MLARIAQLYEIEGDIRGQPLDLRKAVRQLRSRPLAEALPFGYRTMYRAFRAGQIWQKPCVMHCGIGTG